MRTIKAYCGARDQEVHLVLTDQPGAEGHATIHDAEVVCLEIGEQCTGSLCPIGAAPAAVMASRLVRNGLAGPERPRVRAICDGCDRVTEYIAIDRSYATCPECGTTVERLTLSLAPAATTPTDHRMPST